ncbi:GAF domain-containing protein [Duganella sp. FT134W]|uniref:histidine kinase n=1 Tax=Duganella margarita TaxID=2692170 RepID=A0A7X4H245_9BURK|nr:HAMP domain-containing sensor histidine kinase [Duganella margarita]MYM73204.1 GAF domain-containing protein [Duganella margarita]
MTSSLQTDIASIQSIGSVPTILKAVAELTGLGFVCVARVTQDSWHTCAVLDQLEFGLNVGDSLDVTTTICEEVRDNNAAVIIDNVPENDQYRDHHTPRMYGFQSYFSIPLYRPDSEYFGTLCGLDPKPAALTTPSIQNTLMLFAELISRQLVNEVRITASESALSDALETSQLREQFIAVLGHDLRTPLGALLNGTELLAHHSTPAAGPVLNRMRRSIARIAGLIDDVLDFTRGRMGGGISLNMRHEKALHLTLAQVVEELRAAHPDRDISAVLPPDIALLCDAARMGQLLSNLLKNALIHGSQSEPVHVRVGQVNGIFELAVSNQGSPISKEIVAKLFKPFWRAQGQSPSEGLGLGLFIVAEIAKSHGGTLDVVSSDTTTSFIYRYKTASFVERRVLARE